MGPQKKKEEEKDNEETSDTASACCECNCCQGSGPALLALAFAAALVGVALRAGAGLAGEELARMAWGEAGGARRTEATGPPVSVTELIESWGYPAEEHTVTTEDGYLLSLHRIPHGRSEDSSSSSNNASALLRQEKSKVPVMLGHCLIGNSAIHAFGPPSNSLAFLLADAGYDVWMPNLRGNTHSRRHRSLDPAPFSPTAADFWDFGMEEGALTDYPAAVDYVSRATGRRSMHFAGYSMGTTQILMLLAERPEFNARFRSAHLMGPVANAGNATNPLIAIADAAEAIQTVLEFVGVREFLPHLGETQTRLASSICPSHPQVCRAFFATFVGMPPDHLAGEGEDAERAVVNYLTHMPSGASVRQMVHYAQLFRNGGRFSRYDHGRFGNLFHYGSTDPPEYDLSRVRVPTSLYVGAADSFGTPDDADLLASRLGADAKSVQVVGGPDWGHLHFAFSKDAGRVVLDSIVDSMLETDRGLRMATARDARSS